MDELRFVGKWWVPSSPEKVVGGVLTVDEKGECELELIDGLFRDSDSNISMIYGVGQGRDITALNVMSVHRRRTYAQNTSMVEVSEPEAVLVGIHLKTPEQESFDGISVQITNLTTWARQSRIKESPTYKKDGDNLKFVRDQVSIELGEDPRARLAAHEVDLTLVHVVERSGKKEAAWSRSVDISEQVTLRIEADSPRSWKGFDPTLKAFRDLMTLASQYGAVIGSRTLLINDDDRPSPYTVELYLPVDGAVKDSQRRRDMLFTLDDVDLEDIINKWVAIDDMIGLPLDVLLGLDYITEGYYENRIFNVASAGEGFHVGLYPNEQDINSERHAAIKARVSEFFEGKDLEWVKRRVNSNHPGLKHRYLQLTTHPDQEAVVSLLTDVETWARWLKNARNAIGHLNTDELDLVVPEPARYHLTNVSKAFLHLVLLAELGISPDIQRTAVHNVYSFQASVFKKAVEADIARRS
nr:HEPN domain-containing protein [Rhodococcus sp. 06-1059B-a]